MGHIIHMRGDPHRETQELLAWYATGRLDPADLDLVETHLAACPQCRTDLAGERRLASEIAALPLSSEAGWGRLRRRIAQPPVRPGLARQAADVLAAVISWPGKVGWLVAVQLAVVAAVLLVPREAPAPYHVLGAAPAALTGNVIVIFRPDTSEADLRRTLQRAHARLVDGPTAAGAYVLIVPATSRNSTVSDLQRQSQIVLAQPIDAAAPR